MAEKIGSGRRHRAASAKAAKKSHVRNPGAYAAAIGRAKYGQARQQQLAAAGQRRVTREAKQPPPDKPPAAGKRVKV